MRHTGFNRLRVAVTVLGLAILSACNQTNTSVKPPDSSGKMPVTTKSQEARKEFLSGRDLSEKLQAQESLQHFEKAVALDPEFASAELALANNAATAKEFLDHLNKAVALSDKASGRRTDSYPRQPGRLERRCSETEGIFRKACLHVSQRRESAFQPGRIRVR